MADSNMRQHPFDGPEVFDDTPDPYIATLYGVSIVDPYPLVTRAVAALKAART